MMSVLVVVAALGEMACPVIVGNVSTYSLFVHSFNYSFIFVYVQLSKRNQTWTDCHCYFS